MVATSKPRSSVSGQNAKRTTIYDVATALGTSPGTVSSVLNGTWKKRRISQKLADQILQEARVQGYSMNMQASMLRRERSRIIGMIIPKYDNRYFGAIAEHFEDMARKHGLFPVITCTRRDPALEIEAAKALLSYQVDYLIATGSTDPDSISQLCHDKGVRVINLDLPGSLAPSVISDNYQGAKHLTSVILDQCAKDFGRAEPLTFIGGRAQDHNTGARVRGFADAHQQKSITLRDDSIQTCGYAAEKAELTLDKLDKNQLKGLFVNSTITLEGVASWLWRNEPDFIKQVRFGCFDWDPFAAQLPSNVGMIQQDVDKMLEGVFNLLEQDTASNGLNTVPCVFRPGTAYSV